jgi:hypothetical protein
VILYDWYSAAEYWTTSIKQLELIPESPCIVLAAPEVNENLWRRALERRVYDVVCRTGQLGHLAATLECAWKWRVEHLDAEVEFQVSDHLQLRKYHLNQPITTDRWIVPILRLAVLQPCGHYTQSQACL